MNSTSNSHTIHPSSPYIKRHHYFSERRCSVCGTDETCMWRRGPQREVLCNKCGLQLKRKQGKLSPDMRKRKQPQRSFLDSPSLESSSTAIYQQETPKRRKTEYDSSLSSHSNESPSSVFLLENSCESACSSTTLSSCFSAISTPNLSPLPELDSIKDLDFSKDVEASKDWSIFLAEYDAIFKSVAQQIIMPLIPQNSNQTNYNFGLLQL